MDTDDTHNDGRHGERVTLCLEPEQRARLVRAAAHRALESGRAVSVSSIARELLDRAMAAEKREAA